MLVDADDPAFAAPTKPIGPFLPREVAERRARETNETWAEADKRGILVIQGFYNIHISHALAKARGIPIQYSTPNPFVSTKLEASTSNATLHLPPGAPTRQRL